MTVPPHININKEQLPIYLDMLGLVIESLPTAIILLDENNHILKTNHHLLDLDTGLSFIDFIGKRPGHAIRCEHSKMLPANEVCTNQHACQFCGIYQVISESRNNQDPISKEARIKTMINGQELHFDFLIKATPIKLKQTTYTLIAFEDISKEKRKNALEHIFFHDVLNTAGNIRNIIELLSKNEQATDQSAQLLEIAYHSSNQLVEEIAGQRQLSVAEKGTLKVDPQQINSLQILESLAERAKHLDVASKKIIRIKERSESFDLLSDPKLINRVLMNMIKNALEASQQDEVVQLSCQKNEKTAEFSVHNQKAMDPSVAQQVFKRSFSTKGLNRGLGTYSMRLLGEKYLKGKITYSSSEAEGTTFRIVLPLS